MHILTQALSLSLSLSLHHFLPVYQYTEKMKAEGKEPVLLTLRGRIDSYDVETGTFKVIEGTKEHLDVEGGHVQPLQEPNRLKWSPNGQYVARLGCDIISIYSLPSMQLLDKKSLPALNSLDFVWCPYASPDGKQMISYWAPAVGNQPASINIISIPDRANISTRRLFDVHDGRMVWQNEGTYLCVYMTKVQNRKRTNVLMFFRVKEPEVPVEQIELQENIISVSWEPSGDRLAIVYGEPRTPTIAFYSMVKTVTIDPKANKIPGMATNKKETIKKKQINELTLLHTVVGSQANEVIWSPAGNVCAMAYYAPDTCMFELHDVENNVQLASRRHDRGNRLVWDPSGRILASCTITDMKHANARGHPGDGIILYTFQGNILCTQNHEKLFQFSWRPRPKNLLSADEKKKVIKNLRKYEKEFEKEDKIKRQELNQEVLQQRFRLAEDFLALLARNKAISKQAKATRVALRDGYDSDDNSNYDIKVVSEEQVLKTSEQIIG
jgi:translation initiation factor 3 subunit B